MKQQQPLAETTADFTERRMGRRGGTRRGKARGRGGRMKGEGRRGGKAVSRNREELNRRRKHGIDRKNEVKEREVGDTAGRQECMDRQSGHD